MINDKFKCNLNYSSLADTNRKICFRVVTRGTYPQLVKENLEHNLVVLKPYHGVRYTYEVITDIPIGIKQQKSQGCCWEVCVPSEYRTKNNSKFKARALHYALEVNASRLGDDDVVVHLDEETLLTPSCVEGVIRFVNEDKHHIGQGLSKI